MENAGLVKIFDSAIARVLDFLLIYDYDYSKADIARNSDVAYKTLFDIWPVLEKHGLIKHTRNVGKAQMYSINKENPAVKELKKLQTKLLFEELDSHKQSRQMTAKAVAR